MATYAIGDVQGCHEPLMRLLDALHFDPAGDRLWFAGDLVNRGPDSLAVLRFVRGLGERAVTVLGNHDLHLLAVANGVRKPLRKDSLDAILTAPDREELLTWLRHRPMAYREADLPHLMVHAGLPPQWNADDALRFAAEVEAVLRGDDCGEFFTHMYGNFPARWSDTLVGAERWRVITNYLTRMRFCSIDGTVDLDNKGPLTAANKGFAPWFMYAGRRSAGTPVLFGHWAALEGNTAGVKNVFALDTGCVWGNRLSAMRLEDGTLFQCKC